MFLHIGSKENIHGDSYPSEWQNFDIMYGQMAFRLLGI